MVIKIVVFLAMLITHSVVLAADDSDLVLPPTIAPEEFDVPVIQPTGDLTLRQAIVLTLEHNPELATFTWAIRAREIEQIKAGLLPNPAAILELENFAGSGEASNFESAETTFALSQLIELGDKRMKRQQLAATERNLALWDYEVKRVDLLSQITSAFIEVLGAQERLQVTNEINTLAHEIYQTVKKRVDAGKVSPLEEIKARVELSKSRLNLITVERQLTIARHNLAIGWGSADVTFTKVIGDFNRVFSPPDLASIVNTINNNPDLARWTAEMSRHQDVINLAHAETIPDISVTAGIRHLNDIDDYAAVAGISIPLFLFDNKQTGVRRSVVEFSQARKEKETTEIMIRAALLEAYQRLQILFQEITTLHDEVLPGAEAAFNATNKAYQLGKLNLLDLLDAQRTYFEARQQQINAIKEYHHAVVSIERLTGTSLFEDRISGTNAN